MCYLLVMLFFEHVFYEFGQFEDTFVLISNLLLGGVKFQE